MNHRQLGSSTLEVSPICLGTMTFGEQNSESEAHQQLDRALTAGINFIDTAEMYPVPPRAPTCGATETIVGNWLARQPRDRIILATKATGPGRHLDWIRGGPSGFDADSLRTALTGSLQRLRTDYIDLYQLHWPARNQPMFGQWRYDASQERGATPILETLEALAGLVKEGLIRYFGLSNEHPWGVMRFLHHAETQQLPRVVSVQNAFSLLNRRFEGGLDEVCQREQVGLLAYSPLAFGLLSGKYLDNPIAEGRLTRFPSFGQRYGKPGVAAAVRAYVDLARQHDWSPAQMALAWCYQRRDVTSTIIGATSLAQLEENLAAGNRVLSPELLTAIENIHLAGSNPAP